MKLALIMIGILIVLYSVAVFGADLPLPRHKTPIPKARPAAAKVQPLPSEDCIPNTPGMMYGSSTQLIAVDKTCESGLRFVNPPKGLK